MIIIIYFFYFKVDYIQYVDVSIYVVIRKSEMYNIIVVFINGKKRILKNLGGYLCMIS